MSSAAPLRSCSARPAEILSTPLSSQNVYLGNLWFSYQDVAIVVVAVVVFVALEFAMKRTRAGRLARMVAEDPKLAQLAGVDVKKVYLGIFAFEGAAVALAAALVAPRTPILTSMGFDQVIITFVVVVLGGIGSIAGSYVAGVALGLFTAFFGAYVSAAYTTAAAFVVLIAFLVVRPGGLASSAGGIRCRRPTSSSQSRSPSRASFCPGCSAAAARSSARWF